MKRSPGQSPSLSLRLYVAGDSPNTRRALANLRALCAAAGHTDYLLAVVDVLREPSRALQDGVLVAPTLLRLAPGPVLRLMGDLSDRELVLSLLSQADRAA